MLAVFAILNCCARFAPSSAHPAQ